MIKIFMKALFLTGLFFSLDVAAMTIGGIDYSAGSYPPTMVDRTICYGWHPVLPTHDPAFPRFIIDGKKGNSECSVEASKKYRDARMAVINQGRQCAATIVQILPTGWIYQPRYMYVHPVTKASSCQDDGGAIGASIVSTVYDWIKEGACPPGLTGNPDEDLKRKDYNVLSKMPNGGPEQLCFKPLPPLDCSGLGGVAANGSDSFITNTAGYTQPSCVTKCGTDSKGQRQCGNCKVIAKSWVQTPLGGDLKKWSPLIGTFTGGACADDEQDVPPPEPPKCWKSKNNLSMCEQDPAEKCVTVNGVRQCEAGCGFVNTQFFCVDKSATPKPPINKDGDTALPEVDDNVTDPTKALADMSKQDFKDAQKGVESRLSVVSTGIGNLENSVDTSNQILTEIEQNTEGALADGQTQIGLLSDIKSVLSGNGECDPAIDPNCGDAGKCDPSKGDCADFDTGSPKSWWISKYPDGLNTLFAEKKSSFQSSDAYIAMTGSGIGENGGGVTQWQICMPMGFADYGCHTLEISAFIWSFIRACILFGAAILCRRMLIGA